MLHSKINNQNLIHLERSFSQNFDSKGKDKVEYVDQDDQDMVITSKEKKIRFSKNALREHLKEMKIRSDIYLMEMSPSVAEVFKGIMNSIKSITVNDEAYHQIINLVDEYFKDVKAEPGTIGAFFHGCMGRDNFSGPLGCNPKCTGSLPPPGNFEGYTTCGDPVFTFVRGNFYDLNDRTSNHAYIYVNTENFEGFNVDHVIFLQGKGILEATLIFGKKGYYDDITDRMTINNIIRYSQKMSNMAPKNLESGKQEVGSTEPTQQSYFWIAVIIIVILLIIAIIIAMYMRSGKK